MASKQVSSQMSDVTGTTELLLAFQEENQVEITITLKAVAEPWGTALVAVAVALNNHADPVVRAGWVSASAVLQAREYKSLQGLLIGLLYRLDFEVGQKEMEAIKQKGP